MIDEKKLAELRANHVWPEYDNTSTDFNEMADTIEALWKENASLKMVRTSLEKETEGLCGNCQRWAAQYVKMRETIRWIAQTIHQAYHHHEKDTFMECPRNTCDAAKQALTAPL